MTVHLHDLDEAVGPARTGASKAPGAFRTISEVSSELEVPQHVLRFWETRFPQIKPLKRSGGRRYYRPADVDLLRCIQKLLYKDGYTIKGAQRFLREQRRMERDGESASVPAMSGTPQEGDLFPDRPLSDVVGADPVDTPLVEADAVEREDGGTEPDDPATAQHAELRAILAELEEIRRLLPTGV